MLPEYLNESRLWFPGLAGYLVASFASAAQERRALIERYGTQRWLTGDAAASIVNVGTVRLGRHLSAIEDLPASAAAWFPGLTFVDDDRPHACAQVQAAAQILDSVEPLTDTVGCLTRSIHLLRAPANHDVSHSSPELPFSVFVSIPDPAERDADLRIAESLVHESMHLQLSLLEAVEPLVGTPGSCGYSPWKQEVRPVGGLLHGIYVFAVIYQVLGVLADLQPLHQPYCVKRRHEIQTEVGILPARPDGLSAAGNALWRRCRQGILGTDHG